VSPFRDVGSTVGTAASILLGINLLTLDLVGVLTDAFNRSAVLLMRKTLPSAEDLVSRYYPALAVCGMTKETALSRPQGGSGISMRLAEWSYQLGCISGAVAITESSALRGAYRRICPCQG
jgi:hypothetical protein